MGRTSSNLAVRLPTAAASAVRLDPFALPQHFRYPTGLKKDGSDEAAVILDRTMARVSRLLPSGIPMTMRMPVEMFEGVAVRIVAAEAAGAISVVLELMHRDPNLSLPLSVADDLGDVVADWQAWGRVLSLPLLFVEADGAVRTIQRRIGALTVKPMLARRLRSPLTKRRPRFLAKRKVGQNLDRIVAVNGREICAWE